MKFISMNLLIDLKLSQIHSTTRYLLTVSHLRKLIITQQKNWSMTKYRKEISLKRDHSTNTKRIKIYCSAKRFASSLQDRQRFKKRENFKSCQRLREWVVVLEIPLGRDINTTPEMYIFVLKSRLFPFLMKTPQKKAKVHCAFLDIEWLQSHWS